MHLNFFYTDVLIIGGGMAAMRAAIAAAQAGIDVIVVSKAPAAKSGASTMAGGGIAAALGWASADDTPELHYKDIISVGRGLADTELARVLAEEAPLRVRELIDYGVRFRCRDGEIQQLRIPGHSYPRVLHTTNFGAGFVNPLRRKMLSYDNVHLHDDTMAVRLLKNESSGVVVGALCLDIRSGELAAFAAGSTIIATGGYQDIYLNSSGSCDLTGDGYVMAFDAGAQLVDLEMLLYYPTVLLSPPSLKGTLVMYEILLPDDRAGARLVNADGEDLLDRYDRLPVRDELSRRIFAEISRGKGTERGGVYVDVARSAVPLARRRQIVRTITAYETLRLLGAEVAEARFEVGPAAHTVLGGIWINARCESTVPGLYAAGEAAGNIHGANRAGGNALAETQVFGARAGQFAAQFAKENGRPKVSAKQAIEAAESVLELLGPRSEAIDILEIKSIIRRAMFQHVGPTRSEESISKAIATLSALLDSSLPRMKIGSGHAGYNYELVEAVEAKFMTRVALLVALAARTRRESRGHHFRSDYPAINESRSPERTLVYQSDNRICVELRPVEIS